MRLRFATVGWLDENKENIHQIGGFFHGDFPW